MLETLLLRLALIPPRRPTKKSTHLFCFPQICSLFGRTSTLFFEVLSNRFKRWREQQAGSHVGQLEPCYAHAHGCTQASLPPMIVAFSNFSSVVWTENILYVF